jgi:hypothetical protein
MDPEKFVIEAAEAFAVYEKANAVFESLDMRGFLKTLYEAGKIGYLEYQGRAAEFEAMVSSHAAETFAMHRELTVRAQDLGIDLPQPRGGGDR